MIQSPLNYTGGKYKLLSQILPLFPKGIETFVDLFCGGCNVGINVKANRYIYNDSCTALIELFTVMQKMERDDFIGRVVHLIEEYELSDIKSNGYEYYGCNSKDGLSAYNRKRYLRLRRDFNNTTEHDDTYCVMLYVLIVYAFNNQIRFNRNGEFNLPPGKRDFNQKMYDKLCGFIDRIQVQQAFFKNQDFMSIDFHNLGTNDFVYADPPYLITCASYNEQGGWTEENEYKLLDLLDALNSRKIKFALSNVLESKGRTNEILLDWLNNRAEYHLIDLNYSYNNASYQRRNKEKQTREILVVNYKEDAE